MFLFRRLLHLLVTTKRRFLGRNSTLYRPERYYMRGPGPLVIKQQKPPARDQGRREVACRADGHTAQQAHEIWRYCSIAVQPNEVEALIFSRRASNLHRPNHTIFHAGLF